MIAIKNVSDKYKLLHHLCLYIYLSLFDRDSDETENEEQLEDGGHWGIKTSQK